MIHAWLDGELPAEEAARVEQLVATDAAWAAAAAEARGLIAASSRIVRALDVVPAGVIPAGSKAAPAPKRRFVVKPWMRMAAGVVLVVGVTTAVWTRPANTPVPGEMAARSELAKDVAADAAAPNDVAGGVAAGAVPATQGTAARDAGTVGQSATTAVAGADEVLARRAAPERDSTRIAAAADRVASGAVAGGRAQGVPADAPKKLAEAPVTVERAREASQVVKAAEAEARPAAAPAAPAVAPTAMPALQETRRAESTIQMRGARADAGASALNDAVGVLEGCWRTRITGRADTTLVNPLIARQAGDTLILVIARDGRTANVRRTGANEVQGTARIGAAAPVALVGTKVECVPPR